MNSYRSMLRNIARQVTSLWKKDVLYNLLRNFKYNLRNLTGDLDAMISGLGFDGFKHVPKAIKDLSAHFRGEKATPELQDYLDRAGGRMIIQTMIFDDKEIAEQEMAMKKVDPNAPLYKKAWVKSANFAKMLFNNKEVQFTQYHENLLRYAAYLAFKEDMENNNGIPTRWAASNKNEIMAIEDINQRAYEMSNDLLGAYDKISDTGKELRSLLMPFWSWQEVNMKRYYRLFKNGFAGDNAGDFTQRFLQRFLMAKAAKVPYYAVAATSAAAKIALLTAMIQAFNRFVMGDDDDELPEDVKYRPHITLGKWSGKVWYFDRIGAMSDALDWFNMDSFFLETKQIADGQLSLGQYAKKIMQDPMNKAVGQLNPYLKMPIELATGRSLYPDAFHSKTITDKWEHVARSVGFEWPYKALTGKTRSYPEELSKVFLYSIDPEEAAYFNTLDRVREFNERVLDKHFEGFASTKRGTALKNMKTAMRYKDQARYLREYSELDGTPQGLKQSMKAITPLFGMSEKEVKQFMKWMTSDDRKMLR